MPNPILKYFEYEHLPPHLQEVSKPIGILAQTMDEQLPDCAEKSAGLRKLLEAKDCLVRAALEKATLPVTIELTKDFSILPEGMKLRVSEIINHGGNTDSEKQYKIVLATGDTLFIPSDYAKEI